MSVLALIDNPRNKFEEDFSFPIANERIYYQYFYHFALKNNLVWLQLCLNGTIIEKIYFNDLKNEVLSFQEFIHNNNDIDECDKSYLLERVELFLRKLEEVHQLRDDIALFIG